MYRVCVRYLQCDLRCWTVLQPVLCEHLGATRLIAILNICSRGERAALIALLLNTVVFFRDCWTSFVFNGLATAECLVRSFAKVGASFLHAEPGKMHESRDARNGFFFFFCTRRFWRSAVDDGWRIAWTRADSRQLTGDVRIEDKLVQTRRCTPLNV
jgi:hypothetical protein